MNIRIKQIGLGLLLGFLAMFLSCRDQLTIESRKLMLQHAEEMIHFPSSASFKSIDVSVENNEWVALCSSSWVHITKKGKQLLISVDDNPTTELRQAVIQVSSGDNTIEIKLEQMGSALEFIAQKEITFGQFGGERRFYVDASSPSWTVESTAPWLEVIPYTLQGELNLKVTENTARLGRNAQVHIRDKEGRVIHSLEVKQSPILYLVLPFGEFGTNPEAVRFFESERYSRLVNQPDFRSNFNHWGYETVSPVFNYIIYTIKNGKYIGASVYATNRDARHLIGSEGEEVAKLLVDKGYNKLEEGLYYNPKNNVEATIVTTTNNPNITFTAYPIQKPYSSFSELPLWITDFYEVKFHPQEDDDPIIEVVSMGASADEIIAYEQSQVWGGERSV